MDPVTRIMQDRKRFNWAPLSWWRRLRHRVERRLPIRPCMICKRWFFFPGFWRLYSLRWGIPEYCSERCAFRDADECRSCSTEPANRTAGDDDGEDTAAENRR